jgi:regulator of protease activity HflC (stomatin/prohibitin superfamily)
VKFSFGRVTRLCEPGFYPLIPVFQTIRIVPTRARTLELPTQTLATDDGLVFAVDANVAYRVTDPTKALVEVDDYIAALGQMLALSVHDVLATRDRASLRVSEVLDRDLATAMQTRCSAWGVEIERAGFNSIRPLRQTTRITQLASLTRSRAAALEAFFRFRALAGARARPARHADAAGAPHARAAFGRTARPRAPRRSRARRAAGSLDRAQGQNPDDSRIGPSGSRSHASGSRSSWRAETPRFPTERERNRPAAILYPPARAPPPALP